MIKLACEMPTSMLTKLERYMDIDFVLAHEVLQNKAYREYFKKSRRLCILDNSVHELGEPLPIFDLVKAANMIDADWVVAPDNLENFDWSQEQLELMYGHLPAERVAGVLIGGTPADRAERLKSIRRSSMLCLPYRKPRLEWYLEQMPVHNTVHLLGMSSILELRAWAALQQLPRFAYMGLSLDTSKPVKWGLMYRRMEELDSLRNAPVGSAQLLSLPPMDDAQHAITELNLLHLREILKPNGLLTSSRHS